ncbi:MAG: hypothetical protein KME20_00490 [Kaiparowitsia implicata GSE-PSE-MK54-09C]|jgi:predicted NACHT family NTPase|nr:hypothetical protein [Kaiparowitsia implicata GSE-PSE-MK54-09C]
MSKQDYGWKRFWCPRTGSISLADGGYLCDPDERWGKAYNPDLVSLEAIADIPCLILLGEPGIGKSKELDKLRAFTEKKISDADQVLSLNLRSCSNLRDDLFKDETFTDWVRSSSHLYLFLDSLDEGRLSIPNIATGLVDELQKPKYQNHINRLHFRLACRTFAFPAILEEGLKNIWEEANFAIYELAPLRRIDVIQAAKAESFSSDNFLKGIDQKDIVPLAIKPITLDFLLNIYRRHDSQFPLDQELHKFYLKGCKLLCEEVNKSRQASGRTGALDSEQRLIVAARIAAVTIFANRFAVWTGVDYGDVPAEDVLLERLCVGYEKANERQFEITRGLLKEVLDTGLFSSRGLNRMGWAHQTYAEFLAAWYLTQHKTPIAQIKELIFSSKDSDQKLIPQLHETAGWLATMRLDVLQEIIKTDPDVLLHTDVPTDAKVRASIVDNLLIKYEEGKLFDRDGSNYRYYSKLKHPELFEQLRPYICNPNKQTDARDVAIDIAKVCETSDLQEELLNLAIDSTQSIYLRTSAVKALCSMGDADTRLKLKPLAIERLPEDENDQLKGYALEALWSDYLTAEELFNALTRPKKRNFFGSYKRFINLALTSRIRSVDLVVALNWIALQGVRCYGHPFEKLGDSILFKAWENFNLPGVTESFTQVALVQWREYQSIFTYDIKMREQFDLSLRKDVEKRHALVEQAVSIISCTEEDSDFLLSSLTEEDIYWMLERLQDSTSEKIQRVWSQLIQWSFNCQDAKQIGAVITATQTNCILQEKLVSYFAPIDLDSVQANKLRVDYLRRQERKEQRNQPPLLDPPPKERVLQLLDKLETGDLSAWWQLNMEMTLKPESQHYDDEFELDIAQFPGWQEADEATQKRIIEGAKKYIQKQDNIEYDWIGTNTFDRPSLAACRAFQIILKKEPSFLSNFSVKLWKKWVPAIVGAPVGNKEHLEIVKHVYLNAPEESIRVLLLIIDKRNQKDTHICELSYFNKCWDEQLISVLANKLGDTSLKPRSFEQLIQELLEQASNYTRDIEELINSCLRFPYDNREKTLITSKLLVQKLDSWSWPLIWPLVQKDSLLGRQVFESVINNYLGRIHLDLDEKKLADLYIWLEYQYPYGNSSKHDGESNLISRIAVFRSRVIDKLSDIGTLEACAEIKRLIEKMPDITLLDKALINAEKNMFRRTWKPLTPEEFLQLVISQEPSNLDLSNQLGVIDKRTKKMEDEPKIENKISISNSPNSPINAPVGTSGAINSNVAIASSDTKKGINWGNWLAVIGILASITGIMFSGVFNEELRQWLNHVFSTQVQQESTQQAD